MKKQTILTTAIYILLNSTINAQANKRLNLGNDTTICKPASLLLNAGEDKVSYQWQDGSTKSTLKLREAGTYWCKVAEIGDNLIENGDFEKGNQAFNSQYYGKSKNLIPEGRYCVAKKPKSTHRYFVNCGDKTSGSGNQMVVNGSTLPGSIVWNQEIEVEPNTDYRFSTWGASVLSGNPAVLQFSINGKTIGSTFTLDKETCNWKQFYQVWNSGENRTIQISILNQTLAAGGNDFALDDIYFAPITFSSDTVIVNESIAPLYSFNNDTLLCPGSSIVLSANLESHQAIWNTGETSSAIRVNTAGNYFIQTKDSLGCKYRQEINVSYYKMPIINLGSDTTICDNSSLEIKLPNSNARYTWQDGSNSVTKSITLPGEYWVVSESKGCSTSDTLIVNIKPSPVFDLGEDTILPYRELFVCKPSVEGRFLWQNGSSLKSFESRKEETLILKVTSHNQCMSTDTVKIFRKRYKQVRNTSFKLRKMKHKKIKKVISYTQYWDIQSKKWKQEPVVKPVAVAEGAYYEYN